jgi:uncharacterized low-complexity protein
VRTATSGDRPARSSGSPGPRETAGLPRDPPSATDSRSTDSKATNPSTTDPRPGADTTTDTTTSDTRVGDSRVSDGKVGDSKVGDSKAGDSKVGDSKVGNSKPGDTRTGDTRSADAKRVSAGAKPDPRTKSKDPRTGALRPAKPDVDDDVEGDEDIRQNLQQAAAALERRDYDQAERMASAVINSPGSPRQHATARMIHGTVQCAARNDQEAAGIDLRSLENFRNLRARLLTVCRSHGIFTAR